MNAKSIFLAVIGVFVILFGSLFVGMAVGTSDFETLVGLGALLAAIVPFAVLGKRVWMLIPVFAAWSGSIMLLPIPFSVSNIAVGFAVACWGLLVVTRRVRLSYHFNSLDVWLLALVLLLLAGYARNPVGVAALASGGNVGARPYFEVFMALCGYVMLASQSVPANVLRKLPIAVVISGFVVAVGGTIAFFLPQVGIYMYQFYSGFMPDVRELNPTLMSNPESIGRAEFLLPFALALSLYLFATRPPLLNVSPFKPFQLFGLMVAGSLILLSGFRNAIGAIGIYFIIGMILWWRGPGLVICGVMAILGISLIAGVQSAYPLPERIQRPLSFLPGNWDASVVRSAQDSNEWRFDMWREIFEGNIIKNWWIGDGFGFAASELAYYGELQMTGQITSQQLADYYLMTGDLHSGPLSTLKFAGGIGVVLFTLLTLVIAWRFIKLWSRVKHTPLAFPVAFYAIGACYFPIKFVFIFGAFKGDLPTLIIMAGMLRMFEKSAVLYEVQQAEAAAAAPATPLPGSGTAARLSAGRRLSGSGALPI